MAMEPGKAEFTDDVRLVRERESLRTNRRDNNRTNNATYRRANNCANNTRCRRPGDHDRSDHDHGHNNHGYDNHYIYRGNNRSHYDATTNNDRANNNNSVNSHDDNCDDITLIICDLKIS